MNLQPHTTVTLEWIDSEVDPIKLTWTEFCENNDDDTIADVERQIRERGYAMQGGGAATLVWISISVDQDAEDIRDKWRANLSGGW